jgi:ATP-binding cassette subfamily C protein
MTASLFRLFKDVYRISGWRLPLLVGLTFLNALFDGATLAVLLPLLKAVGGVLGSGEDRLSQIITLVLAFFGYPATALTIAVFGLCLIVLGALIFLAQAYLSAKLQTNYVAHWQRTLFVSYFQAEFGFFRTRRAGDLISAAITEPIRLGGAFYQANLILSSVLFIGVQVLVALVIAPLVVALLFGAGVFLFLVSVGLVRRGLLIGEEMTVVNADFQSDANELVQGAKFVKATATESRAVERLAKTIFRLRDLTFANGFDVQIVRAIFEYASAIIVIALLVAGPLVFAVDVGAVIVIVAMFVRLFPKVTGLRQCQQSISLVLPAFDAVSSMVREAEAVAEIQADSSQTHVRSSAPVGITYEHVAVNIEERTVLRDVSLSIAPGEFLVLTGPTGAGKTTLVDCLLGLRRLTSGSIRIDDKPLNSLAMQEWRSSIGYLGQDPLLFHASIEENLKWVRPESGAADISQALDHAAATFVERLPHRLDTIVGDAGSRLSGGERQRIALARALLGAPRLLVLDEATSALDAETEAGVVETISRLKGQMTIIAITHRPALLSVADRVVEIKNGQATLIDHASLTMV